MPTMNRQTVMIENITFIQTTYAEVIKQLDNIVYIKTGTCPLLPSNGFRWGLDHHVPLTLVEEKEDCEGGRM